MTQAFSHSSLRKQIRPRDFADETLNDPMVLDDLISQSVLQAERGFRSGVSVKQIEIGQKFAYTASSLEEKLILRKIVNNLQRTASLQFNHRDQIAAQLTNFLKEGVKYRIYRLDIASFFETIDIENIENSLSKLNQLSSHSKFLTVDYIRSFQDQYNVSGIPRGIELSASVSELVLLDFDRLVKEHHDVFFYARYVDDMIFITSSTEISKMFCLWIESLLPTGLKLNIKKQKIIDLSKKTKNFKNHIAFDFLGYEYRICNPATTVEEYRPIIIDLSSKKIKSLKTKIAKAFYSFKKVGNYDLLYDRLSFLSSNRDIITSKNTKIGSGVYYSYKKIDPEQSLKSDIDYFLRQNTMSKVYNLSKMERENLLKLSFYRGFKKRIYKRFSPNRLMEINEIWK